MRREVRLIRSGSVVAGWSLLILLVCSSPVLADPKDDGFKALIRHLETQYKARRTHIPFLGLANLAVKIARPAGVKGFRLAVFEDQDFTTLRGGIPFDQIVHDVYGSDWQPLVRVFSRRDGGEQTYIYGRANGSDLKLAIVVLESHEAVLVEATVNMEAAAKYLSKPETIASLTGHENRKPQVELTAKPQIDQDTLCSSYIQDVDRFFENKH